MSREEEAAAAAATAASSPTADYRFGRVLGEGAFARVVHGRAVADGHDVAIKIMLKSHVQREGKAKAALAESRALQKCRGCRQVIAIERTFQDDDYLFFVLELAAGGNLWHLIKAEAAQVQPHAARYAAELAVGLEFLHEAGLAHRDLKPENIMLTRDGHLKITDFGSVLDTREPKGDSGGGGDDDNDDDDAFEGTAEYIAPEVLQGEPTTTACDLWALGVIIFQLVTGDLPFTAMTDFLLWEKIIAFAEGKAAEDLDTSKLAPDAEAVVRALLVKDASSRLGADPESRKAMRAHPFFAAVDWEGVRDGTSPPPMVVPPQAQARPPRPDPCGDDDLAEFSLDYFLGLDGQVAEDLAAPLNNMSSTSKSMFSLHGRSGGSITRQQLDVWNFEQDLRADEHLDCTRILWKRKGLIWRERIFVLTTAPRLLYYDAHCTPPELRGEIAWTYSKPAHCRRRSTHHFDLITDGRDYHLASFDDGADAWIARIEATLDMQANQTLEICRRQLSNVSEDTIAESFTRRSPSSSPRTSTSAATLEGWLLKQSRWPVASPKKRYVVLRGLQLFVYTEPPNSRTRAPTGVMCCSAARPSTDGPDRFGFDVDVATGGRSARFFAVTDAERQRWIDALLTVIEARDS